MAQGVPVASVCHSNTHHWLFSYWKCPQHAPRLRHPAPSPALGSQKRDAFRPDSPLTSKFCELLCTYVLDDDRRRRAPSSSSHASPSVLFRFLVSSQRRHLSDASTPPSFTSHQTPVSSTLDTPPPAHTLSHTWAHTWHMILSSKGEGVRRGNQRGRSQEWTLAGTPRHIGCPRFPKSAFFPGDSIPP